MDIQTINAQLKRHAEAAYALLPETFEPHKRLERVSITAHHLHEDLERKLEAKDWQTVIGSISAFIEPNSFASELVQELSEANQLIKVKNVQVAIELMAATPDDDKRIIGECMNAISYGKFIQHDGQFKGITDLEREEMQRIVDLWPNVQDVVVAVAAGVCALNTILGYPHDRERDWSNYISVSYARVDLVAREWRKRKKEIANS